MLHRYERKHLYLPPSSRVVRGVCSWSMPQTTSPCLSRSPGSFLQSLLLPGPLLTPPPITAWNSRISFLHISRCRGTGDWKVEEVDESRLTAFCLTHHSPEILRFTDNTWLCWVAGSEVVWHNCIHETWVWPHSCRTARCYKPRLPSLRALTSYVTLSKLVNLSVPHCSSVKQKIIVPTS